jgi:hypothetical protein
MFNKTRALTRPKIPPENGGRTKRESMAGRVAAKN